jgi:dihydrofolate reductase
MRCMIMAHDLEYVIGLGDGLPWYLPRDLQWFKEHTEGNVVIIGSNTYKSLPANFDHMSRIMVVLSTNPNSFPSKPTYNAPDHVLSGDPEHILSALEESYPGRDIFVCGGANVYEQFFDHVDRIYITRISTYFDPMGSPGYVILSPEFKAKMQFELGDKYFSIYIEENVVLGDLEHPSVSTPNGQRSPIYGSFKVYQKEVNLPCGYEIIRSPSYTYKWGRPEFTDYSLEYPNGKKKVFRDDYQSAMVEAFAHEFKTSRIVKRIKKGNNQ